jgi:hypothetical protein
MFIERNGSDDDEDIHDLGGSDQGGGDQGCGDQDGDDELGQESDDELLPNLEMLEASRGKQTNKKIQAGEDLKWEDGDLEPKDMSTNVIKPKGMEDCKNAVEYFKKMFNKDTFQLLLEEMNIHHLDVNKKIGYVKIEELRKAIGILMYMSEVSCPTSGCT